jgi:hypothetical protein
VFHGLQADITSKNNAIGAAVPVTGSWVNGICVPRPELASL